MHPEVKALLKEAWGGETPPPRVRLIGGHLLPFEEAVAAARTCYSGKGLITPEEILSHHSLHQEKLKSFAQDLYRAGHHTVFQHAHFTFAIEGVSRLFVWSFLHTHPFYNSEQVSQRYVHVGEGSFLLPRSARGVPRYSAIIAELHQGYEELTRLLIPTVESLFFKRFPGRGSRPEVWRKAIQRKAQEVARYLLPQATSTFLHHTISALTLMRYVRAVMASSAPWEARYVVARMIEEVGKVSPPFVELLEPPLPEEELFPWESGEGLNPLPPPPSFLCEPRVELLSFTPDPEALLPQAAAGVVGRELPYPLLTRLLDPAQLPLLCDSLNLAHHHPLLRVFLHVHYVFKKTLSLTADSQNQRHRLTPAARPRLPLGEPPAAILPLLVTLEEKARGFYEGVLARAFEGILSLQGKIPGEDLLYLLPNATAITIVESSDFLSLYHKHRMRLCYNAQEEIWRLSYEEAKLVREVHPELGAWLLPPCSHRERGGLRPVCPEGSRFCGVKVWALPFEGYERDL